MVNNGITSVYRDGSVTVGDTPVGKGVFSELSYPANAIIGEITGEVVKDSASGAAYSFEIDERTQLEPYAPFRYLNHSCDPNCEFDWFDDDKLNGDVAPLYLIALRDIWPGEELTIDYNWPAISAIPCHCSTASCRGWIVSIDELDSLVRTREDHRSNDR